MALSSHRISGSTKNNNNNNKVIHHQWSHSRNNNKDFIDYKYIDSLSPCYSYHASQVGTQSTRREIDPINKRLHHSIGAEGIPACSISFFFYASDHQNNNGIDSCHTCNPKEEISITH
jgi:hypothetical protein